MAQIVSNDLLEIAYYTQFAEQVGIMVWHYECIGGAGIGLTQNQAADSIGAQFVVEYAALTFASVSILGCTLKILTQPLVAMAQSIGAPGVGTQAGEPLPRQVAGFCKKLTALAGRRNRGRAYFPFPGEGWNTSPPGIPNAAWMAALAVFQTAMMNIAGNTYTVGADSITIRPVVYSRVDSMFEPLVLYTNPPKWATQRRRGSFGAPNTNPF